MQFHGDGYILGLCFPASGITARASGSVRSLPIVSLRLRCLCVQRSAFSEKSCRQTTRHQRKLTKVCHPLSRLFHADSSRPSIALTRPYLKLCTHKSVRSCSKIKPRNLFVACSLMLFEPKTGEPTSQHLCGRDNVSTFLSHRPLSDLGHLLLMLQIPSWRI
jgi:hypothetical protein